MFTGGIDEHAEGRAAAAERLGQLGLELDAHANDAAHADAIINADRSAVSALVITAAEDAEVARLTREALAIAGGRA